MAKKALNIDDKEWRHINRYLHLPFLAKSRIEGCLYHFARFSDVTKNAPTPSRNKRVLKKLHRDVVGISKRLSQLDNFSLTALLEASVHLEKITTHELIKSLQIQLNDFSKLTVNAHKQVKKRPPGVDPGDLDWLIESCDSIFRRFLKKPIGRSKSHISFILQIAKHAGYPLKHDRVDSAIKRLKNQSK